MSILEKTLEFLDDSEMDVSFLVKICLVDLESKMSQLLSHFAIEGRATLKSFQTFSEMQGYEAIIVKVPGLIDAIIPVLRLLPSRVFRVMKDVFGRCTHRYLLDIRAFWCSSKVMQETTIRPGQYGMDVMFPCDGSHVSDQVTYYNTILEPLQDALLSNFPYVNEYRDRNDIKDAYVCRMFYIDKKDLTVTFAAPFYFSDNGENYMCTVYTRLPIDFADMEDYMNILIGEEISFEISSSASFWDEHDYDDPYSIIQERLEE